MGPVRHIGAERLSALDGLRGVAALLVVVVHFQHFNPWFERPWLGGSGILSKAHLAVDLFFVLSGFVLAHVYADTFRRGPLGRDRIWAFWWARFARVYPLHLAVLLLLVGLVAAGFVRPVGHDGRCYDARNLVASLALVHAWGTTYGLCWNVPSWSIGAEATAYALFPWLVPLVAGARRLWRPLVPVACIASLSALALVAGDGGLNLHHDLGAVRCLPSFVLGIWLFLEKEAGAGWQRALQSDAGCLLAGVSVVLLMHFGAPDVPIVAAMALVVAGLSGNPGLPGRVFGGRLFAWLGAISYAVYMLHWPLLLVVVSVLEAWFPAREAPPTEAVQAGLYALFFAALLVVSTAAHHLLELPARRWLRRGRVASRPLQRV